MSTHHSVFRLLILTVTLALPACAVGNIQPLPESLPIQRNIFTITNRLNEIARSGKLSLKQTGTIKYGQFEAICYALAFSPPGRVRHAVLLTGGVHGDEPAGVEMLLQAAEGIAREPSKYEGYYFDIIPLVNPGGWVFNPRHNRDGIDINGDFASYDSQEARLVQYLTQGKAYDLAIDFHEDSQARGFYIYQYAAPESGTGRKVIAAVRKADYPIEQNISTMMLKTNDGLIDVPLWSLPYMQITRQLSCPAYFRLDRNSAAFSVETPEDLAWDDRVKMHRTALNEILGSLEPSGKYSSVK